MTNITHLVQQKESTPSKQVDLLRKSCVEVLGSLLPMANHFGDVKFTLAFDKNYLSKIKEEHGIAEITSYSEVIEISVRSFCVGLKWYGDR